MQLARVALLAMLLLPGVASGQLYAPFKVSAAPSGFVSIAASDFGPGDTYDLSSEMPVDAYVPLEGELPIDTTAWTVETPACNLTAIQDALDDAVDNTVVQAPSGCVLSRTTDSGAYFISMPNGKDGLVLRGDPTTGLELNTDYSTTPDNSTGDQVGWSHKAINFGSSGVTVLNTWTWTAGFDRDTTVVTSSSTSGLAVGDLVRLGVDSWCLAPGGCPSKAMRTYEVTAFDATTITLDRPLGWPADASGLIADSASNHCSPSPCTGTFTGAVIEHLDETDILRNAGVENVLITHDHPHAIRDSSEAVTFSGCHDCWMRNIEIPVGWGSRTVFANGLDISRILIEGNRFEGQHWKNRCVGVATALPTANPATVTIDASGCGDVRTWCSGLEPAVGFPSDFGSPGSAERTALAGKVLPCTCSTCTGSPVTLTLQDNTGTNINGSSFSGSLGGSTWLTQKNAYGISTFYVQGGAQDVQIVNNVGIDIRVWLIKQNGAAFTVDSYNYVPPVVNGQSSRSDFCHGACFWQLTEGNHFGAPITSIATAYQGRGITEPVYASNRVPKSSSSWVPSDVPARNGIADEQTDQGGAANENAVWFSNHLPGHGGMILGSCDHDEDGGGVCDYPYQMHGFLALRNVWTDDEMDSRIETAVRNPTVRRPSVDDGTNDNDAVETAPSAWTESYPSSITYDSLGEAPYWWCDELPDSMQGVIGAPYDDENSGTPNYTTDALRKLPAQRREDGDACTPR